MGSRVGHDLVTNIFTFVQKDGVSQVALVVQNPLAKAGAIKGAGSVPASGRSPEEGNDILEWIDKIPWTEEPGRLYNPWDHKELDTTEAT